MSEKRTQLYGIFEVERDLYTRKKTNGGAVNWTRIAHSRAFPKAEAVRRFQNMLLEAALGGTSTVRELRPVGHEITWTYLREAARRVNRTRVIKRIYNEDYVSQEELKSLSEEYK